MGAPVPQRQPQRLFVGDAWFGSNVAAMALSKICDVQYVAQVKMASSGFPKKYLDELLKRHPSGSWVSLSSMVGDVDLVATAYKYNRKRTLKFVSTKGAGRGRPGVPYLARFPQPGSRSGTNLMQRAVPRPELVANCFEKISRVDDHNNDRQHRLALEEHWVENCQWNRLDMTLFGMEVIDTHKAMSYALSDGNPMKTWSIKRFVSELAKDLIFNELDNGDNGVVPVRQSSRKRGAEVLEPPTIGATPLMTYYSKKHKTEMTRRRQFWCRGCCVKKTQWICTACGLAFCRDGTQTSDAEPRYCFQEHIKTCTRDAAPPQK